MSKLDDIIANPLGEGVTGVTSKTVFDAMLKQQIKELFVEMVKEVEVQRWGKRTSGNQFAALIKAHIDEL